MAAELLDVLNVAADKPAMATTLMTPGLSCAIFVAFRTTSSVLSREAPLGSSTTTIR